MKMVAGVVAGYLTFFVPILLMFYLSGQKAHEPASLRFMVLSTIAGIAFALAAGFVAARVSQRPMAAWIVAALLGAGAISSMLSTPANGRWSQWAVLLFMVPSAVIGSRIEESH